MNKQNQINIPKQPNKYYSIYNQLNDHFSHVPLIKHHFWVINTPLPGYYKQLYLMESAILELPVRPKGQYQGKFKQRQLASNHFKVSLSNLENIYLYRVNFEPKLDEEDRVRRNKIYMQCGSKISEEIYKPVFSGSIIYTTRKPSWGSETSIPIEHDNRMITMKLNLVKSICFNNSNPENQKAQLTFLNNYLRTAMKKLNFVEIGKSRKFFDSKTKKSIPDTNFFIYQGFTANFCRLEGGLFLKVDSTSKIVNKKTVLEQITDVYSKSEQLSKEDKREKVQELFQGSTVMANYGSTQYWIIEKIIFDQDVSKYHVEELNETLENYYSRKYGLMIKAKKQPLIEAKDKNNKSVLLVPQFCLLTGISADIDDRKRRQISKFTNVKTSEKVGRILDFRKKFKEELKEINPQELKNNLGITISDDLYKLNCKQAQNPVLKLGGKEQIPQQSVSNFQLFNKQIFNSNVEIKCCLICFENFQTHDMMKILNDTSRNLNVNLNIEKRAISYARNNEVVSKLKEEIESCDRKKKYNMFLIVLPASHKASYKEIKQICCSQLKVLSQIVLDNFNNKKGPSVGTKVLLQIIAKVGNVLWTPITPVTKQHEIVVVGVNSSAAKNVRGMKRVGFCATMNQDMTKFYSDSWLQKSDSQILECLDDMVASITQEYLKLNNTLPKEIVILRDGCSSSQVRMIQQFEIPKCKETLNRINSSIKLTYVVIDKKPTQKFLATGQNGFSNPNAGTIINSQLVSQNYEFFLISQKSNIGTTVPTFYKVLYCDSDLEAGMLEELLYTQCFNYANWTGSIKVPSPIQYAKKLCEFMGTNLKEDKVEKLQNHLYYI